jgi:hypothetical protein
MDACVGAPHLSRDLKPTVTIRDWSPQNMTRVRFARKVQDYALARCGGKGQLWVKRCLRDDVGITTGVAQIAADLPRRPGRQGRANCCHRGWIRQLHVGSREAPA